MKFREIANRLNGVSTPIFGVPWTPATLDRDVARRVITAVEHRRVLFSAHTNEVPSECVASVLAIRELLTNEIGGSGISAELAGPLRVMRRYCLQFLDRVGATEDPLNVDAAHRHLQRDSHWQMHDYWFGQALGELRAAVGLQVAIIAAGHGLDVEVTLASQLPPL